MNFHFYLVFLLAASLGVDLGCIPPTRENSKQASTGSSNESGFVVNNGGDPLSSPQSLNKYGVQSWSSEPPSNGSKKIFNLVFQPAKPEFQGIRGMISSQNDLNLLVNALNNSRINLPTSIPISFEHCVESNAFWDPGSKKIKMCYELVADIYQTRYRNAASLSVSVETSVLQSIEWVLLHEVGHAVVSELKLPVTGSAEDVADQFSAIASLHLGRPDIIFGGVNFLIDASYSNAIEFRDSHSPSPTRAANLSCYIYGADPITYGYLVPVQVLPERTGNCKKEFKQFTDSWSQLLAPHISK